MANSSIYIFAAIFIISQIGFMVLMIKNAKFVLKKANQVCDIYKPVTLLTVPCKGIDTGFEDNVKAFLLQDYSDYYVNFVVESHDDPAYEVLVSVKQKLESISTPREVNILVAGITLQGSQKNHNLLHSIANAPDDAEVFAFADSDARPKPSWLTYLIHPLHAKNAGASTGYRWIIPAKFNVASLLLSSMNAKVAQFLGKSSMFNQAWGGSMAIKKEMFYQLGIDKLWLNAISDDLSLTFAVRKSGFKLRFAPACFVATFEQATFGGLFEFARRQFLITRKSVPLVWLTGLASSVYGVTGLWGSLLWAVAGDFNESSSRFVLWLTFAVFFTCQIARVFIRHYLATHILSKYENDLKKAAIFDYFTAPLASIFMLIMIISSLFGNTIVWRGRKYRILDGYKTIQLPLPKQ